MLGGITSRIRTDSDYPARTRDMDMLTRVLEGTIYDNLPSEFHDERNNAGKYVPLRNRRPSVRYGLCKIVVDDSVSFLFGEGRFPTFAVEHEGTRDALADIFDESDLTGSMIDAATRGSVGSIAVIFRVLKGRVFWEVCPTLYLTPTFDPNEPDTLLKLTHRQKMPAEWFTSQGYTVPESGSEFWFCREWTADAETWYEPQPVGDMAPPPVVDTTRTVSHALGFVPAVWIKNLPGGVEPDGACTFRSAIDTSVEIDYQLSQAGRGLKYSSDPLLMVREPSTPSGEILRGADNALIVSEKGDAKLLEIGGGASAAVVEYVRALREMALESIHGNRSNADKISAAQSGAAMKLLYAPLLNLTDRLRNSYGRGLIKLAHMVIAASKRVEIKVFDKSVADMQAGRLRLVWPDFFPATMRDQAEQIGALRNAREGGLLSQETAVRRLSESEDVADAAAELARIRTDEQAADARAKTLGAQVQDRQQLPA